MAAKSGSQNQWLLRQSQDSYVREAKLRNYKSRAAFKLLEMDKKYRLFKRGMTVVDLGFAPGSWSQVAAEKTAPNGRVVGVDILFVPPPEGVTAIQGNFLTKSVQDQVRKLVCDPDLGRKIPKGRILIEGEEGTDDSPQDVERTIDGEEIHLKELEMRMAKTAIEVENGSNDDTTHNSNDSNNDKYNVDVILSDMCAPLNQSTGFWLRSVNDPFVRMANISGLAVRDHGASIV